MRKPRVNVHIRPETWRMLEAHVARPGATKAGVVDTALAAYLTPENDDRRDVAIIRRLDRLGRRLEKLDRDMAVIAETLSLFVRYSLSVIPPLPEAERDAAGALGRQRYAFFVERLAKRLSAGKSLAREVIAQVTTGESDFFAADADDENADPGADVDADTGTDLDSHADPSLEPDGDTDSAAGAAGEGGRS